MIATKRMLVSLAGVSSAAAMRLRAEPVGQVELSSATASLDDLDTLSTVSSLTDSSDDEGAVQLEDALVGTETATGTSLRSRIAQFDNKKFDQGEFAKWSPCGPQVATEAAKVSMLRRRIAQFENKKFDQGEFAKWSSSGPQAAASGVAPQRTVSRSSGGRAAPRDQRRPTIPSAVSEDSTTTTGTEETARPTIFAAARDRLARVPSKRTETVASAGPSETINTTRYGPTTMANRPQHGKLHPLTLLAQRQQQK